MFNGNCTLLKRLPVGLHREKTIDCSPECMASYRILNATLVGRESMNCFQCSQASGSSGMSACRAATTYFGQSCLGETGDSPMCTSADEQCEANSTCKIAYKAYDDCESAAATGNTSDCPQSCKKGLVELYRQSRRSSVDQLRMRCLLQCPEVRANDN